VTKTHAFTYLRVKNLVKIEKSDDAIVIKEYGNVAVLENETLVVLVISKKQQNKTVVGEKALNVLKKISKVKFSERTVENVKKVLTKEELPVLKELFEKGILHFYKKGKYEHKAVIQIKEEFFQWEKNEKEEALKSLLKKGFVVLEDEKQAAQLEKQLKKEHPKLVKEIVGLKAFDGRVYVAQKRFLLKMKNKVMDVLKKKGYIDLHTIKKDKDVYGAYKTVLVMMAEGGEVVEKQGDVFWLLQ